MVRECDVVIVGGGAAGLSAGVVLARARALVHVVDSGRPRNAPAAHSHGFLSRDGVSPSELLAAGRDEVLQFGGAVAAGRVVEVDRSDDDRFRLSLDDGAELNSRAVAVATGLADLLPNLPGLREGWGKDVLHCPHCHGYELLGRPIGVLGGQMRPMSLHQAALARRHSDDVVFFPDVIELTHTERDRLNAFGVRIVDGRVARVVRDDHGLSGIELVDGTTVARSAVYVGPRPVPRDELLRGLGCDVDDATGLVRVDGAGQTSVPGAWAAGNVVDPRAQVVSAAGAGSVSGIAITGWLLEQDLSAA